MKASEYLREAAKRIVEEAERIEESEAMELPPMPNIKEAVREVAALGGPKSHTAVRLEITTHHDDTVTAEWAAYIPGHWTSEYPTIRQAINELHLKVNPPPEPKPEEVLAEVEAVLTPAPF